MWHYCNVQSVSVHVICTKRGLSRTMSRINQKFTHIKFLPRLEKRGLPLTHTIETPHELGRIRASGSKDGNLAKEGIGQGEKCRRNAGGCRLGIEQNCSRFKLGCQTSRPEAFPGRASRKGASCLFGQMLATLFVRPTCCLWPSAQCKNESI